MSEIPANVPSGSEHAPKRQSESSKITDHLANQRTLLAWVRTGLSIIGLGFIISRFGLLLRQEQFPPQRPRLPHYSALLGAGMSLVGALLMLGAFLLFLRVRKDINLQQYRSPFLLEVILIVLMVCAGVFLCVYLLFTS